MPQQRRFNRQQVEAGESSAAASARANQDFLYPDIVSHRSLDGHPPTSRNLPSPTAAAVLPPWYNSRASITAERLQTSSPKAHRTLQEVLVSHQPWDRKAKGREPNDNHDVNNIQHSRVNETAATQSRKASSSKRDASAQTSDHLETPRRSSASTANSVVVRVDDPKDIGPDHQPTPPSEATTDHELQSSSGRVSCHVVKDNRALKRFQKKMQKPRFRYSGIIVLILVVVLALFIQNFLDPNGNESGFEGEDPVFPDCEGVPSFNGTFLPTLERPKMEKSWTMQQCLCVATRDLAELVQKTPFDVMSVVSPKQNTLKLVKQSLAVLKQGIKVGPVFSSYSQGAEQGELDPVQLSHLHITLSGLDRIIKAGREMKRVVRSTGLMLWGDYRYELRHARQGLFDLRHIFRRLSPETEARMDAVIAESSETMDNYHDLWTAVGNFVDVVVKIRSHLAKHSN